MSKIYCGKGKEINGKFGAFYKINICMDEIPAEHVFKAKNGKKYVTLNMNMMRQEDDRGNTHTIVVDTWKPSDKVTPPEDFRDDSDFIPF
jgi:hypothetical protein